MTRAGPGPVEETIQHRAPPRFRTIDHPDPKTTRPDVLDPHCTTLFGM